MSIFNFIYLPEILIVVSIIFILFFDLFYERDNKSLILKNLSIIIFLISIIAIIPTISEQGFYIFLHKINDLHKAVFKFDWLSITIKYLIYASTIIAIIALRNSNEIKKEKTGEFLIILFSISLSMSLLTSTIDLLVLYVILETISLLSYTLSGYLKFAAKSSEASFKYFLYGAFFSACSIYGISIIYGFVGSFNYFDIKNFIISLTSSNYILYFSIFLIFVSFAIKLSIAPFHFWTPDVYEGSPISFVSFLTSAGKAVSFGALLNFFLTVFEYDKFDQTAQYINWKNIFIVLSISSITIGTFAALWQKNIKRLLAYSSIAHVGYFLLGLAAGSKLGIISSIIYLIFYTITNGAAFFALLRISENADSEDLESIAGYSNFDSFTSTNLALYIASLIGLPPTLGFAAKFLILWSLIENDMYILAAISAFYSVLALFFYSRILKALFIKKVRNELILKRNIDLIDKISLILLSVFTIGGIFMLAYLINYLNSII